MAPSTPDAVPRPLARGDVLHGYASGVFVRDHYDCCRIEAVGPDWIVARDEDGALSFACGTESLRSLQRTRDEPCTVARVRQDDGDDGAQCPLDSQTSPPLTDAAGDFVDAFRRACQDLGL
jgi:hypothetical protein